MQILDCHSLQHSHCTLTLCTRLRVNECLHVAPITHRLDKQPTLSLLILGTLLIGHKGRCIGHTDSILIGQSLLIGSHLLIRKVYGDIPRHRRSHILLESKQIILLLIQLYDEALARELTKTKAIAMRRPYQHIAQTHVQGNLAFSISGERHYCGIFTIIKYLKLNGSPLNRLA